MADELPTMATLEIGAKGFTAFTCGKVQFTVAAVVGGFTVALNGTVNDAPPMSEFEASAFMQGVCIGLFLQLEQRPDNN